LGILHTYALKPRRDDRIDTEVFETATSALSKKWNTAIVRELLDNGPQGFSDLEGALGDISGKVLSECLDTLQDEGIVERRIIQQKPLRVEYGLTAKGHDLKPVIDELESWATVHVSEDKS